MTRYGTSHRPMKAYQQSTITHTRVMRSKTPSKTAALIQAFA
jgi:hypothetical protein